MFERQGLTTQEQIDNMRRDLYGAEKIYVKKRFKRRLRYIKYLVCSLFVFLILLNIVYLKRNGKIPNVFGYYLFSVQSGSMSPTLEVGDIIVSKKPTSTSDLAIGTIVTYYNVDGCVVTHRITGIENDISGSTVYLTKGDYIKNTTDLELLTQDRIIATYCFTLKHK